MRVIATLMLEHQGRPVPLARTHQREALRAVALAALSDMTQASSGDELINVLLRQEAERLQRAFAALGLVALPDAG